MDARQRDRAHRAVALPDDSSLAILGRGSVPSPHPMELDLAALARRACWAASTSIVAIAETVAPSQSWAASDTRPA